MSIAIAETIQALQVVLQMVPVGTNLALLHLLWSILNGSFLGSRGAIFPGMQLGGFSEDDSRRSWAALRYGMWRIEELIAAWRAFVLAAGRWQAQEYEGYRPVAADITAFWRPRLKGWTGKFFHGVANRLQPGVGLGLVVDVGQVDGQRLSLIRRIIHAPKKDNSQEGLKSEVLTWLGRHLAANEVAVFDAGAHIAEMQLAQVARYVVRMASNCTARRSQLPDYQGGRPRQYGRLVRPWPRQRKGKKIAATPADSETTFVYLGRTIRAQQWHGLVLPGHKVADGHDRFNILVFLDPLYGTPLVLGTTLAATPETIFRLYLDRWPVEQVPLVAKQTLGLQRQFVFAPRSCARLPELALLAANILSYLAATLPAWPTGFWDRRPKKRAGGCGAFWPKQIFQLRPFLKGDFGKSALRRRTCRRVWRPIGGEKGRIERVAYRFLPV
jgi:hypothetical protein